MNRKQIWIAVGGLVLVVTIAVVWRHRTQTAEAEPADKAVPVAVALIQRGTVTNSLTLTGAFIPYQNVEVHAKVAGYIRNIYVDYGSYVKAGQTLAILEVPELEAEVVGAKAGLKRAQDAVTRAQSDIRSVESVYAAYHAEYTRLKAASEQRPGLIAEQELDDAMAKDKDAEARIESGKAALAEAQSQLGVAQAELQRVTALADYTRVTAPFDGVVTKRWADVGTLIQAGTSSSTQSTPVVTLAQWDRLRLVVPVPESAVPLIKLGSQVQVHVIAMNRNFDGKVARFAEALNEETRTMHTEIDVENPGDAIKDGMFAQTRLVLEQHGNVLKVPIQAVERKGSAGTVFIVNSEGVVEERNVTLGLQDSNYDEVLSGLSENDRVILGGHGQYHPGEKVEPKVQPEISPAVESGQQGVE
jgi:RND family efflux transporter MFP subunit